MSMNITTSPSKSPGRGIGMTLRVAFVIVAVVLASAAVGLNSTVQAMGVFFKKEAVPLRKPINSLPTQLGPYLQINTDEPMPKDQEHTLGTKDYLNRLYVDTRLLQPRTLVDLKSTDPMIRESARRIAMNQGLEGLIYFHTAYYTGMVDTVAHIPERCMVGGGFDPENPDTVSIPVWDSPRNGSTDLRIKYIEFTQRDPDQMNSVQSCNIGYFFAVNGEYESDALSGVRAKLQNLTERFGYYCKFEMKTFHGKNRAQVAQDRMADFLKYLMPEAEKILPDWSQVQAQSAKARSER